MNKEYREFFDVIISGDINHFKEIITRFNDINETDDETLEPGNVNWSGVHYAVWNGRHEILKHLISLKAKLNLRTGGADVLTPQQMAVIKKDLTSLKLLHGARIKPYRGILSDAIRYKWADGTEYLILIGIDVNDCSRKYKDSPLSIAAGNGSKEIVRLLLSVGADMAAVDWLGLNPVEVAVISESLDCINEFISAGYPIDKTGCGGLTLLGKAIHSGHAASARRVIELGANIQLKDLNGKSGIDYCAWALSELSTGGYDKRQIEDFNRLLLEMNA